MVTTGFEGLDSAVPPSYLVVGTVHWVQPQGLGVEVLLLHQLQGFRKAAVPC